MVKRKSTIKGRRMSRIGSYAVTSSITDHCITCTTFNILAPIYKRLSNKDQSIRESEYRAYWLARNQRILDSLLYERSSIICLQEFWVGNEELVNMYEKRLGDAGYINFKLARTNDRGDGLLTAVHKDYFRVLNHQDLFLNNIGDRVAQLLHVELRGPFSQYVPQEMLIVNTHLLFPHDSSLCLVRLHQVYEILQNVEAYQKANKLNPLPIILCGDWNGSKRGHVYKFLRSQGFVSSYDTAHQYTDADAHKWVSHRNHRGNICGVDFIWLLNPNRYRKLLKTSWNEAVFGMFKLSLTGHRYGLSAEEMKDLWVQADIDGNGVLDYSEFQLRIWNPTWSEDEQNRIEHNDGVQDTVQTIGFSVKNAVFFPTEVEKGTWPEDYSLSDHARLTVVFSPVRMPCSQLIL